VNIPVRNILIVQQPPGGGKKDALISWRGLFPKVSRAALAWLRNRLATVISHAEGLVADPRFTPQPCVPPSPSSPAVLPQAAPCPPPG
jgi:hypothetical protein